MSDSASRLTRSIDVENVCGSSRLSFDQKKKSFQYPASHFGKNVAFNPMDCLTNGLQVRFASSPTHYEYDGVVGPSDIKNMSSCDGNSFDIITSQSSNAPKFEQGTFFGKQLVYPIDGFIVENEDDTADQMNCNEACRIIMNILPHNSKINFLETAQELISTLSDVQSACGSTGPPSSSSGASHNSISSSYTLYSSIMPDMAIEVSSNMMMHHHHHTVCTSSSPSDATLLSTGMLTTRTEEIPSLDHLLCNDLRKGLQQLLQSSNNQQAHSDIAFDGFAPPHATANTQKVINPRTTTSSSSVNSNHCLRSFEPHHPTLQTSVLSSVPSNSIRKDVNSDSGCFGGHSGGTCGKQTLRSDDVRLSSEFLLGDYDDDAGLQENRQNEIFVEEIPLKSKIQFDNNYFARNVVKNAHIGSNDMDKNECNDENDSKLNTAHRKEQNMLLIPSICHFDAFDDDSQYNSINTIDSAIYYNVTSPSFASYEEKFMSNKSQSDHTNGEEQEHAHGSCEIYSQSLQHPLKSLVSSSSISNSVSTVTHNNVASNNNISSMDAETPTIHENDKRRYSASPLQISITHEEIEDSLELTDNNTNTDFIFSKNHINNKPMSAPQCQKAPVTFKPSPLPSPTSSDFPSLYPPSPPPSGVSHTTPVASPSSSSSRLCQPPVTSLRSELISFLTKVSASPPNGIPSITTAANVLLRLASSANTNFNSYHRPPVSPVSAPLTSPTGLPKLFLPLPSKTNIQFSSSSPPSSNFSSPSSFTDDLPDTLRRHRDSTAAFLEPGTCRNSQSMHTMSHLPCTPDSSFIESLRDATPLAPRHSRQTMRMGGGSGLVTKNPYAMTIKSEFIGEIDRFQM